MEAVLRIAADVNNLARVREFVERAAATLGVAGAEVDDLVLAVDECVTNVIVHGYRGRGGEVELAAWRQADALAVRLRDTAPPFDPTQVPEPDLSLPLEQRPIGGMGVHLARRLVDGITHQIMPRGGNELTLWKRVLDAKGGGS